MTDLVSQLDDLLLGLGVTLLPSQRAQAVAKLNHDLHAASSKNFLVAEKMEAASTSPDPQVRSAMKFAGGLARRYSIDLSCTEASLNAQISKSEMSIEDRMSFKTALHAAGAIES